MVILEEINVSRLVSNLQSYFLLVKKPYEQNCLIFYMIKKKFQKLNNKNCLYWLVFCCSIHLLLIYNSTNMIQKKKHTED